MSRFGDAESVVPLFGATGGDDPEAQIRQELFDRRVIMASGPLDEYEANRVGVALMALDATGDGAVHLQIDSGEGTVGAALTLMDIIGLLGVPVRALCTGQAVGPAVGVLAACHHRLVSPRARLRLFEPPVELSGSARQLEQMAAAHLDEWRVFCSRVAELAGQPLERVVEDAAAGRFLTAEEAVAYGLADEVAAPDARMIRLPGRPMGFGPR